MQCSSMQGLCAGLTGGSISPLSLYICNVAVCKASAQLIGGVHLPSLSLSIHICSVVVCKASMLDWLGVHLPSILCIVLDLAVGVAVCKASVLD